MTDYLRKDTFQKGDDVPVAMQLVRDPISPTATGVPFVQADFASIAWTLLRIYRGKKAIVTGYDALALTVSSVVFDTMQAWSLNTVGYNFRHVIDETILFPVAEYQSVYDFVLTNGESFAKYVPFSYTGPVDFGALADSSLIPVGPTGPTGPAGPGAAALFVGTGTVTVANTVTETTLIGAGLGTLDVAASTYLAGEEFTIRGWGVYSTKATGPGNISIDVELGSEVIAEFTPVECNGAQVNAPWWTELHLIRCSDGVSGVVTGYGQLVIGFNGGDMLTVPIAVGPTTISSAAAKTPNVTAQWSLADASNSFACYGVKTDPIGAPA